MTDPLVSVVIPVYNIRRYIGEAIQSVLDQDFPYFEILAVDDGSTDDSVAVIQSFQDSRIRICRQENRGLPGARNTGIRAARGELIAFLDGDDHWLPNKLSKHVAHMASEPSIGISFSRSEYMDQNGKPLGTYTNSKLTEITPLDIILMNPTANGSSVMIRRQVLEDIAYSVNNEIWYHDERFKHCEDVECWIRIALTTSWRFEGLADPLTLYRMNPMGMSTNLADHHAHMLRVIEKIQTYDPAFIAEHASLIKAYNVKYLARTALRFHNGPQALGLMRQAFSYDWRILLSAPRASILILGLGVLFTVCPPQLTARLDKAAHRLHQFLQQQLMHPATG